MAEEAQKPIETNNETGKSEVNPFETHDASIETTAPAQQESVVNIEKPKEEKPAAEQPKPATEEKPIEAAAKKTETKQEPKPELTPSEIKFANEASKKYFELVASGDGDKLYDFLHEQRTLSTVDKLTPEQQIKLNLKYQHPEYSEDEIDGLFSDSFERPEKPEQLDDELDDEYKSRLAKWQKDDSKFTNKLTREAKSAVKQLSAKKTDLIFPEIKKQETAAPEPTAEEIAENTRKAAASLKQLEKGLSEFNGFTTAFKNGEVEIPVSYTISSEEKEALKSTLENFNVVDHFGKEWVNEDGVLNGSKYAEQVYWLLNKDKILAKVASEAANRRLDDYLKEQKNIDYSGGRQANGSETLSPEDDRAAFFFKQR